MDRFEYPYELEADDNGTVMATFPDLPGATFGEGEADAVARAHDLLETALQGLILARADIPDPSPANGRQTIRPSLLACLKIALYRAMRHRGWRKADLARALGADPTQVDRLLRLDHASTVDQLDHAIAACGCRVAVEESAQIAA